MPAPAPLPSGSTIGILGGGQLGRMLAMAAARLGMKVHIFCPDPKSPAFDVTPLKTIAGYEDRAALTAFAAAIDVVTYEFENVPAETASILGKFRPLHPGARALAISQDRLAEKAFLTVNRVPVAPFAAVVDEATLTEAMDAIGYPAVLKTTRMGYDGKGQRVVKTREEAEAAFAALSPKPLVAESFIPFAKEISVVVARNTAGAIACFDPAENEHREHILRTSTVPAGISAETARAARDLAGRIVDALDYVGVLGIEFFVLDNASLLVNEIAPRVHNSGHWTEAVCSTDQFEQHIRAIAGWPLGDPARHADVMMENLIGKEADAILARLAPGVRPQLYGKAEARPGRKMGHINHVRPWPRG